MPAKKKNNKLPWVGTAVICEKILRDKDDVVSIIRVIDTFTVRAESRTLPPGIISFVLYVMFKADAAFGKRTLHIVGDSPTGETVIRKSLDLEFQGGVAGPAAEIHVRMGIKEAGIYWFNVMLNKQLMTRIPLRVVYRRQSTTETDRDHQ